MNTRKFVWQGLVCLLACCAQTESITAQQPTPPRRAHSSPALNRPELTVGAAAPDWQLKTPDGETIALAELRGKVVVLDFWANWCGPCHKLMPQFDQLAREYQNKPVRFFTLSIWPGPEFNPQTFLKKQPLVSTFLLGDDAVADKYGIWGVPTYLVIGPTGKIADIQVVLVVDPDALHKQLREAIEKVLPAEHEDQSFCQSGGAHQ